MPDEKSRTLSYRRAEFFETLANGKTLEHFVIDAMQSQKNIEERRTTFSGGYTLECLHQTRDPNVGHFVHIAAYTKDERASIVLTKSTVEEADLETKAPPPGADYLDGDLMALIAKNHVIVCKSQLHDKKLETYLKALFDRAKLGQDAQKFRLENAADVSVMNAIQKEGIKEITVDATLYEATIDYAKRQSATQKITGALMDEVKKAFSKSKKLKDVLEEENLTAAITFSFDGRRKGEIGPKRLDFLASEIAAEEDSGFALVTRSGNVIRGDQMTRKKPVMLPPDGKTVSYNAAFQAMGEYLSELKSEGLTEQ